MAEPDIDNPEVDKLLSSVNQLKIQLTKTCGNTIADSICHEVRTFVVTNREHLTEDQIAKWVLTMENFYFNKSSIQISNHRISKRGKLGSHEVAQLAILFGMDAVKSCPKINLPTESNFGFDDHVVMPRQAVGLKAWMEQHNQRVKDRRTMVRSQKLEKEAATRRDNIVQSVITRVVGYPLRPTPREPLIRLWKKNAAIRAAQRQMEYESLRRDVFLLYARASLGRSEADEQAAHDQVMSEWRARCQELAENERREKERATALQTILAAVKKKADERAQLQRDVALAYARVSLGKPVQVDHDTALQEMKEKWQARQTTEEEHAPAGPEQNPETALGENREAVEQEPTPSDTERDLDNPNESPPEKADQEQTLLGSGQGLQRPLGGRGPRRALPSSPLRGGRAQNRRLLSALTEGGLRDEKGRKRARSATPTPLKRTVSRKPKKPRLQGPNTMGAGTAPVATSETLRGVAFQPLSDKYKAQACEALSATQRERHVPPSGPGTTWRDLGLSDMVGQPRAYTGRLMRVSNSTHTVVAEIVEVRQRANTTGGVSAIAAGGANGGGEGITTTAKPGGVDYGPWPLPPPMTQSADSNSGADDPSDDDTDSDSSEKSEDDDTDGNESDEAGDRALHENAEQDFLARAARDIWNDETGN